MPDRAPLDDPADVLSVYTRDPGIHVYGIADVVQLWSVSRWWRDGDGVVGVMDLPGSEVPVLYAVAATDDPRSADAATLDLLAALSPGLPERFVIHGPRGLDQRLSPAYTAIWCNDYLKMQLTRPELLPPVHPDVEVLGAVDRADLEALYASDPHAGDFFHPGLLDTGHYVGLRIGGELVATAGVHVVEPAHGVAAVANVATAPDHRRRGYGSAVVASLLHRLLEEIDVVGLNVREANAGARRVYERLGFEVVARYAEAELSRRPADGVLDSRPTSDLTTEDTL